MKDALPRWADVALLPAVCLAVALLAAGAVVALVGWQGQQVFTVKHHLATRLGQQASLTGCVGHTRGCII